MRSSNGKIVKAGKGNYWETGSVFVFPGDRRTKLLGDIGR